MIQHIVNSSCIKAINRKTVVLECFAHRDVHISVTCSVRFTSGATHVDLLAS